MSTSLASLWDIDPDCIYLNHGSFGPSPQPVREARERYSARLERQPMRFFCRDLDDELDAAANVVAKFVGTKGDRIALIDNASVAMNIVAFTIDLKPGDEIILNDHEYGAVRKIWQARCDATGARIVNVPLPFPPTDDDVVAAIEKAITKQSRVIVVSHVTSATACVLPVKKICQMARRYKVPVAVDGPHALAMLDVNIDDLCCDFYCASGHKWLCGPFGSGFLWVHPKHQGQIFCPVVSWGGSICGKPASWKDRINWLGTRDPACMLALADAVQFFTPERLAEFRRHAHELVCHARRELLQIDGSGVFCTPHDSDFVSMAAVELPQTNGWKPGYHGHPDALQIALRDRYGIELLMGCWNSRRFLRVSAHLYTTSAHIETLLHAVRELLYEF